MRPVPSAYRSIVGLVLLGAVSVHAAPKKPKKDTTAPVVEHTPVASHDGKGPVVITAKIVDDGTIFEPTLVVRMVGAGVFMRVPLVAGADADVYTAEVPTGLLSGDVEYLVEAFDENGNGPSRVGDEASPLKITRAVAAVPDKPPVPPPPTALIEEDNTGLIVGGIVVGTVVVLGAAAGIGFAVYALRPPAVEVVQINVAGPAPFAGAL